MDISAGSMSVRALPFRFVGLKKKGKKEKGDSKV
jgi:hypothetical protein